MKFKYSDMRISSAKADAIERVNSIIDDYAAQDLQLTLRQVYYQFVSRGWCPNNDKEYKKLGDIVSDGRMAGLIDWSAIEDRTRFLRQSSHWKSPSEIVAACAEQFKIDKWAAQENYVEVWIEKDALVGVIEAACVPLDVPYFSCRGYASQTALWDAGRRIGGKIQVGKCATVLHLGDHDPSGIDMTRDIGDRVELFAGEHVEIRRLALNMDQVRKHNPPPNPAKLTDSRCAAYTAIHGNESWELDALEPTVLINLIQNEIKSLLNASAWKSAVKREKNFRSQLSSVAGRWAELVDG